MWANFLQNLFFYFNSGIYLWSIKWFDKNYFSFSLYGGPLEIVKHFQKWLFEPEIATKPCKVKLPQSNFPRPPPFFPRATGVRRFSSCLNKSISVNLVSMRSGKSELHSKAFPFFVRSENKTGIVGETSIAIFSALSFSCSSLALRRFWGCFCEQILTNLVWFFSGRTELQAKALLFLINMIFD